MSETLIDLLRHGEPVGGRRYRGGIDDPLSEEGWAQMWAAVEVPAPWSRIVTSPLTRCRAFADALSQRLGLEYRADPRLREVGFGTWEGLTGRELERDDPGILQRFYADPQGQRPAGAEPLDAFSARVVAAYAQMLQQHAGEHLLIITHAGVIRALVAHVLQAPLGSMYRMTVPNASLTRVRITPERPPTLMFHARPSL